MASSNKKKSNHGLTFTTSKKPIEQADPVTQRILSRAAGDEDGQTGTSIFDPVLCELAYRWFCPPKGAVLDPFAGGSVRGIVASKLGRSYFGIDLREEQVEANHAQAKAICSHPMPNWVVGDSAQLDSYPKVDKYDFLFSCPPYGDLERYSDDPRDLSTMPYKQFLDTYLRIIEASCKLLRPNRFACFVVGDIRDQDDRGVYRGFHMRTIAAFHQAGLDLYNHAILITASGTLGMRMGRGFESSRKLGKTHQDVLVFIKGDPRKATEAIGPVEFGEPAEFTTQSANQYGEVVTAAQLGGEI